jgi:hypothetical protein
MLYGLTSPILDFKTLKFFAAVSKQKSKYQSYGSSKYFFNSNLLDISFTSAASLRKNILRETNAESIPNVVHTSPTHILYSKMNWRLFQTHSSYHCEQCCQVVARLHGHIFQKPRPLEDLSPPTIHTYSLFSDILQLL